MAAKRAREECDVEVKDELHEDVERLSIEIEESAASAIDEDENEEELDCSWEPEFSRYDAEDRDTEPDPMLPAYDGAYQACNDILMSVLEGFPDITSAQAHDDRLTFLKTSLEHARALKPPTPVKIALLGDAGKGKTSTLNALLDQDIAETAALGNSCTNIVFEYGKAFDGQTEPFMAEITWHSTEKIKEFVKEQIRNYSRYTFDRDEDWSVDETREYKGESDTAMDIFLQVFCDKPQFRSSESAASFLLHSAEHDFGLGFGLLDLLVDWCHRSLRTITNGQLTSVFSADSAAALRRLLFPVIRPKQSWQAKDSRPSLWPFIQVCRIGLRDCRTVESFTPVDMPGRADRNRFRVHLTNDYLKECDGVWVFANIDRIIDNNTVREALDTAFEQYPLELAPNTALIATHSDVGANNRLIPGLHRQQVDVTLVRSIYEKEKVTARSLARVQARLLKPGPVKGGRINAESERKELEQSLQDLRTRKFNLLVDLRNGLVTRQLRITYEGVVPNAGKLSVFCVSNSEYAKYKIFKDTSTIDLEPRTTGIPALRRFALELAAPRLQASRDDNVDRTVDLLNLVKVYLLDEHVSDPEEVIAMAGLPQQGVTPIVESLFSHRRDRLKGDIILELSEKQETIRSQAQETHDHFDPKGEGDINHWHWRTYVAWCRHHGFHKTLKQPRLSWNEEFLRGVDIHLRESWAAFKSECLLKITDMITDMEQKLDEIPKCLNGHLLKGQGQLDILIQAQKNHLTKLINAEHERQERFLNDVWMRATKEQYDCFFRNAMEKTYDECAAIRGAGVTRNCVAIIQNQLRIKGEDSPFASVGVEMSKAIDQDMESHIEVLSSNLREPFEAVVDGIRTMLTTEAKKRNENREVKMVKVKLRVWQEEASRKMAELQARLKAARTMSQKLIEVD